MNRSKSSKRWLLEHHRDRYVQRSRQQGYRSRASYKLLEIEHKDHLFRPGMVVVDLGASPGGWSQVAVELVGDKGLVVASDILSMNALAGVEFVPGDFTEPPVLKQILMALGNRQTDLVMSDMAPNMSGIRGADQARAMYLAELALDFAGQSLCDAGTLLVKVFQGDGFDDYLKTLRKAFASVVTRKPDASRARSREVYLLARGFRR